MTKQLFVSPRSMLPLINADNFSYAMAFPCASSFASSRFTGFESADNMERFCAFRQADSVEGEEEEELSALG